MRFFTFASERLKPQITICNYATVFSSDTSTFIGSAQMDNIFHNPFSIRS